MKNINTILFISVAVIILGGCVFFLSQKDKASIPTATPASSVNQGAGTSYTLNTIAMHKSETDCWMSVNGKVYDVTSYIPTHPNTDIILGCGKEATVLFEEVRKHAGRATGMLDQYLIGTLQN